MTTPLSEETRTYTNLVEQVFFRAGVLGQMEELRDDRLSKIMSWLQAYIRGYLSRKEYKKLQEQRWEVSDITIYIYVYRFQILNCGAFHKLRFKSSIKRHKS